MNLLSSGLYVFQVFAWCPQRSKGIRIPGNGVRMVISNHVVARLQAQGIFESSKCPSVEPSFQPQL